MKVILSNYRNHWISPYTILEKVLFWKDWDNIEYDEPWVKKWSDILTPISVTIENILDTIHPRIEYVKLDRWDTWNMDTTLGKIILPMLKQLRDDKQGSPTVDLEDVPEELRYEETEKYESQFTFDFYHENDITKKDVDVHVRWNWVMDEMIFAFEHLLDDSWEEEYRKGTMDVKTVPCKYDENGKPELYKMVYGPNHTYELDYEGIKKVNDRIDNGLRLFGKYYRGLWN